VKVALPPPTTGIVTSWQPKLIGAPEGESVFDWVNAGLTQRYARATGEKRMPAKKARRRRSARRRMEKKL
jgi:hypothetical protein